MRSAGLGLLLAACLLIIGVPLAAQSADEEIGQLPLDSRLCLRFDTSDPAIASSYVLPEGTQVSLEFMTYVSTRAAKRNDRIRFRVVSDVSVDGLTVIPKGSEAWGTVTRTKKPHHFSRNGKLQIALQSVTLLNGQTIAIRVRAPAWKQTGKWDLREPDSLQAPLLLMLVPAMLAIMPSEDRQAVLGSALEGIIAKGSHDERPPGVRIEAVISRAVELNREEFSKLQPATLVQAPAGLKTLCCASSAAIEPLVRNKD